MERLVSFVLIVNYCFGELINGDASFGLFDIFGDSKRDNIDINDVIGDINPAYSIYRDLKYQAPRQVQSGDSDCTAFVSSPFPGFVAPGSTHLFRLHDVSNPASLKDFCMSDFRVFNVETVDMGFVEVDYDCIKIVVNPPYFSTGCVLPKRCGDLKYKTLSFTWLGTGSNALCYTNSSVSWKKHTLSVSQFDFGKNQKLCDYQNISAYYRLATTSEGYRIITQSCYNFNMGTNASLDLNNIELVDDKTVKIHLSGNVVSQKMCRNWDMYGSMQDAVFSIDQWFYDINYKLECTNINMTYPPIKRCSQIEDVDVYLEPIPDRVMFYLARSKTYAPTIGYYRKCAPFDVDVRVDVIEVTVDQLTTSFFEMLRDMFVMIIEDVGTLLKNYILFMMNNITTPLLEDILTFLLEWIVNLLIALQPLLSKYYIPQLLVFYVYVYYHFRDHFLSIVMSLSSYLLIFAGETFINLFLLN